MKEIIVKTSKRNELIDITEKVNEKIAISQGFCLVYVPHTTAAITINEGADPDVRRDISAFLEKLIPVSPEFKHFEGNSDSHIKSTLVGHSEWLIVKDNHLILGRWQSIYFCEFDGPRTRKVFIDEIKK